MASADGRSALATEAFTAPTKRSREAVRRLRRDLALALGDDTSQERASPARVAEFLEQPGLRQQAVRGSLQVRIVSKKPVVARERGAGPARGFVHPSEQ